MRVYIEDVENTKPLRASEIKWMESFGELMDKMPKRFGV